MLFQYTRLERESIRLVRFLPYSTYDEIYLSLEHHQLANREGQHSQYTVVAYGQGDGPTQKRPITLAGRSFMISPSLWTALSLIWKHHGDLVKSQPLWIDALCINPRDEDEDAQRLTRLASVYASASTVILWLGGPDEVAEAITKGTRETDENWLVKKGFMQESGIRADFLHGKHVYLLGGKLRLLFEKQEQEQLRSKV